MTEAVDPNRPNPNEQQPTAANEARAGTTAEAPDDRREAAENRGAEKPELESPTRENLERVGVDAEHKTDAMRKHHRGTFP